MKRLVALATFFLVACAQEHQDPRTIAGVDQEFAPYIEQYVIYKGSPIAYDIPMQFANLSYPVRGLCTKWSSGERQIEIDKYIWSQSDEGKRLQLIAHELGHCDLNRGHEPATEKGVQVSIMFPSGFGIYGINIPKYMNELFHPVVFIPFKAEYDRIED